MKDFPWILFSYICIQSASGVFLAWGRRWSPDESINDFFPCTKINFPEHVSINLLISSKRLCPFFPTIWSRWPHLKASDLKICIFFYLQVSNSSVTFKILKKKKSKCWQNLPCLKKKWKYFKLLVQTIILKLPCKSIKHLTMKQHSVFHPTSHL